MTDDPKDDQVTDQPTEAEPRNEPGPGAPGEPAAPAPGDDDIIIK